MLDASLALLLGTNNAPSSRSKVRHTHGIFFSVQPGVVQVTLKHMKEL